MSETFKKMMQTFPYNFLNSLNFLWKQYLWIKRENSDFVPSDDHKQYEICFSEVLF